MVGSVRRVAVVEWQWNGLIGGEVDDEDADGQPSTESESAQSAQSRLLPLPHSSSMPLSSLGEADRGRTGRIGRRIPMHTEAAFTTARHSVIPCNSRNFIMCFNRWSICIFTSILHSLPLFFHSTFPAYAFPTITFPSSASVFAFPYARLINYLTFPSSFLPFSLSSILSSQSLIHWQNKRNNKNR